MLIPNSADLVALLVEDRMLGLRLEQLGLPVLAKDLLRE